MSNRIKQKALGLAVEYLKTRTSSHTEVLKLAEKFESYLSAEQEQGPFVRTDNRVQLRDREEGVPF